jgi:hypothetical protein
MLESDLEDIIEKRTKEYQTWDQWKHKFAQEFELFTLQEYVLAYCGRFPRNTAITKSD